MALIQHSLFHVRSLTTRLILVSMFTVVTSSACLSLIFVHQAVNLSTTALLENGRLIATSLAETSRYGVLAGNMTRVSALAQYALMSEAALYAIVFGPDGQILTLASKQVASSWFTKSTPSTTLQVGGLDRPALTSTFVQTAPIITPLRKNPNQLERAVPPMNTWLMLWTLLEEPGSGPLYEIMVPILPAREFVTADAALAESLSVLPPAGSPQIPLYGAIAVGLSGESSQRELHRLVVNILLTTLIVMFISLVLIMWIAKRITAPLGRLRESALTIAEGNWQTPIPVEGRDEVGDLGRAVTAMTGALQQRDTTLRELTHQLEEKVKERTQDLVLANAQLQDLDRLKTMLVSTASHELRTPLTSIKMHVDNLYDGVAGMLSPPQREALHRIRTNLERLRGLLEDLLDLSRLEAGGHRLHLEPVDLGALIDDVLGQLAHHIAAKQILVSNAVPNNRFVVEGDRVALTRIFLNLMDNAIKFSSTGGSINVAVAPSTSNQVSVSLIDHGYGIPAEDLANVFLPFFRSGAHAVAHKGVGLGLALVKQLVQVHQGSIEVESTLGTGSVFLVRLPLMRKQPPTQEQAPPSAELPQ